MSGTEEEKDQQDAKKANSWTETDTKAEGSFCLRNNFHNFLMLIAVMCLTTVNANVSTFNQVILCMKNETASSPPHYMFTKNQELWLQRAIGMGSLLGTFPFNYGYSRVGAKWLFGAAGMVSGMCAGLTPLAASMGFPWLFSVRMMTGFLYAADFSVIGLMVSKWSPLNRSAVYISLLTGYTPLASIFTFAASGPACKSPIGWPLLYYCSCGVTIICFIFWFIYYDDEPVRSSCLSQTEYDLLSEGKFKEEMQKHTAVPYWKLLKSPTIWVVWLNAFADIFSSFFLYAYVGRFYVNVLKFDTVTAGYLASLPPIPFIILKVTVGYINDRITFIPERLKLNIFNSVCVTAPSVFFLIIGFITESHRYWTVVCLITIYVCFSFSGGGFYKCAHLSARQYSQFVIAVVQFLKSITLFLVPTLFDHTLHTEEDYKRLEMWRPSFFTMAGLLLGSGIIFYFFSRAKPLPFILKENEARKVMTSTISSSQES